MKIIKYLTCRVVVKIMGVDLFAWCLAQVEHPINVSIGTVL